MSIEVIHLTKQYDTQKAVNNISFRVDKGEIVGFLGPNGAGKSTTMKIATAFIPPTSGTAKVCGFDVVNEPMQVKKMIGYLPEHNPLYLDMYVWEYLLFVGNLNGVKRNKLKSRVKEMISLCGLEKEQNKKIESLSKGYRQRVGLAQALIHDPEVLILDEPTTGLDPNQLVEIRTLIKNVGKDKTVILSTHIMQEVQALCDRVIVIDAGEIVADDPIEQLKSKETTYSKVIVELDQQVGGDFWNGLSGIEKVEEINDTSYALICAQDTDIRQDLFNYVSDSGRAILGLRQEEITMEAIFHHLTNKKGEK